MIFDDKLHEECGVFGAVVNNREASGLTYNALSALQHRGQEAQASPLSTAVRYSITKILAWSAKCSAKAC